MLAWHFLPEGRRLRWGTKELVVPGQKLTVRPPLHMCRHGLHAGIRAIDALRYAPGPVVCRVELGGEILEDEDKCCATERTCVWLADASEVLHRFACWCAEGALAREREAGREPAAASWAAVQAKRDWLAGKITGQELTAAWKAAVNAAESTAENVAGIAAKIVARSAARSAARKAAMNDAVMNAAENVAWNAAWNAAWNVALNVAMSAAEHAAMSAARYDDESIAWNAARYDDEIAARAAARSTQNEELTRVLLLLSPTQTDER